MANYRQPAKNTEICFIAQIAGKYAFNAKPCQARENMQPVCRTRNRVYASCRPLIFLILLEWTQERRHRSCREKGEWECLKILCDFQTCTDIRIEIQISAKLRRPAKSGGKYAFTTNCCQARENMQPVLNADNCFRKIQARINSARILPSSAF